MNNDSTNNQIEPNQKPPKKKNSLLKNIMWAVLFVLMAAISLGLIFHSQVEGWLIKSYQPSLTNADIMSNKKTTKASFDFAAVEDMDLQKVAAARASNTKLNIIGIISIPDIDMNLTIAPGVDNYTLALAVGTLNPEQEMGEGNYALAAHHMVAKDALFGPLVYKAEKKQKIYLTDLDKVYEYKITKRELIAETDVQVIDPVEGKKLITMITCDASGDKRWMVQGELVKTYDIDDAPKKAIEGFQKAADVKENF